ncbi:CoA ester lyase [Microbulbifer sp. THAF38]|uniref:HpcH/HpaI aldolase/citrate lyase family protein n=1 Tax=Microbulbifer sp. THAF38 TaxID=2587856 RepID=UPI00126961C5|nr:CoA ester lyase [Microbulbifer sp. THAF38]QFT55540.1 Citrate lyase subunit beta [Microbulbifer sp. THAF38]
MHGYGSGKGVKAGQVKINAMHLKNKFHCRSILFVPASRPSRYRKAVAGGADIACVDLEDVITPGIKVAAWQNVRNLFTSSDGLRVLKINPLSSESGLRDVLLLLEQVSKPDIILLPKVESAEEIAWLNQLIEPVEQPIGLLPLIETAKGLQNSREIATSKNVLAIAFGSVGLCTEIGVDMSWDSLFYARSRILQAATYANIGAIDGPCFDLEDTEGLLREAQRVAALGFSGKVALNPRQIDPIHQGFSPTEESLQSAHKIVQAFKANSNRVLVVDGRMVDLPVIERALKLVSPIEK